MQKFNTLWKGKWVSIISPIDAPYECLHEEHDFVLVLPYLEPRNESEKRQFIVRKEFYPSYQMKDMHKIHYTVISGAIEKNEIPFEALIREIKEESGIIVKDFEIIEEKEYMPLCKSTDFRGYFYILKIKNWSKIVPEGDGTEYEAKSESILVTFDELTSIISTCDNIDFLLYSFYNILCNKLNFL